MKRRALVLSMIVLFAAGLSPVALSRQRASRVQGASEAARAFYRYHFSHDKCYDAACLKLRRKWLTAELYELLKYERRRELPPDVVPYLGGDPFTVSQETPHSFRIGKAEREGRGARVEVYVYWLAQGRVVEQRRYSFVMSSDSGRWRIADIIDHKGESLRDGLRELRRKDSGQRAAKHTGAGRRAAKGAALKGFIAS
jgi:hypothetical protein